MHSFSPYSVPITDCSGQGLTDQVYDVHLYNFSGGPLPAVCGVMIIPAPMAAPLGTPCRECETRIAYLAWNGSPPHLKIRRRLPRFIRTIRRYPYPAPLHEDPTCIPNHFH